MIIDWPEQVIPLPSIDYSSQTDGRLLTQEMEVGTRQRQRFSDDNERVAVAWSFTALEFGYFKTFVSDTLAHGAKSVNISLLTVNGIERVEAKIIGGAYTHKYKHFQHYDVNAAFEIIGPPKLSGDLMALLELLNGEKYAQSWLDLENRLYTVTESRNITI